MTTPETRLLADSDSIHSDLVRIASEITQQVLDPENLLVVGIHGKGVWIAEYLNQLLNKKWETEVPSGTLDVGMHRDDLDQNPLPNLQPTQLPSSIKGKTIILVDDVIYSGRTIRAALDSLHDFGRPEQVLLAVLIDRGDRRLPITPNFTGRTVNIDQEERIQVSALDDLKGFEVYINAA
ncbi:bifunctional pyr operon transcriptional regulator/uracil phosphoribosyltransferase PyrR [bacterium]|nr:bifunctional pyr operon transcriptional regulator/uracil phosphoribosyltransferase PyrR [bacterium]